MKILVATTAVALIAMGSGLAADGKYLNVAILTLPAQYLADIPLDQRDDLLISLSSSLFEDSRLDLQTVVAAAIECINKTIIDTNLLHGETPQVTWSLKLKAEPEMLVPLKKYERDYEPRNSQTRSIKERTQIPLAPGSDRDIGLRVA